MIFNSVAGWIFGYEMRTFRSPFPASWSTSFGSAHELGVAVVTLTILVAIYLFFRFTSLGLAMRAGAQIRYQAAWSESALIFCSHLDGVSLR